MMRLRWLVLAGILAFAAFAFSNAPAALVTRVLPQGSPVALTELHGTVWQGGARLDLGGLDVGQLNWSLSPWRLLIAQVQLQVEVDGQVRLQGQVRATPSVMELGALNGQLPQKTLNEISRRYDIAIPGDVDIDALRADVALSPLAFRSADGRLQWSGGAVRYILGGQRYDNELPPLEGQLGVRGNSLELVVYRADDMERHTLLALSISDEGWAKAAVTGLFMEMTGTPWQGNQPQDAFVLEVEEKVF